MVQKGGRFVEKERRGGPRSIRRSADRKGAGKPQAPHPGGEQAVVRGIAEQTLVRVEVHPPKPLDRYIVDFYCAELMLAIKIDGDSHNARGRYDEARTRRLNALGVEVVRYANAEVMNNVEGVCVDLQKRLSDMRTL